MSTAREILLGPMAEAARLLPSVPFSPNACILLLAIAGQESNLTDRRQKGNGPARGLWQNEKGGGVHGVMTHPVSKVLARGLCDARGVQWDETAVWAALERDDVLAAGLARLLLRTDPKPIPERSDMQGGWDMYVWNWRPGKPHRDRWDDHHAIAVQAVIGAEP